MKRHTSSGQKGSEQVLETGEKGMNSISQIIYYLLVWTAIQHVTF